jgi:hypothetical protein
LPLCFRGTLKKLARKRSLRTFVYLAGTGLGMPWRSAWTLDGPLQPTHKHRRWIRRSIEEQWQHDSLDESVDVRAIGPGPVEVSEAVEALALIWVDVVFRLLQATSAL